ncbi:MAG TPA: hypothetical protein VMW52_07340, partial [Phycisphaerae bacterium]|nr:hypothetical protein [Phycisphaerae bacterium]
MSSKGRQRRRASQRFLQAAAAAGIDMNRLELAATVTVLAAEASAEGEPKKRPTFSALAYSGGVLHVGWGGPVYVDLAGLKAAERVTALLDHDRSQIVGQATAEITARQVKLTGVFTGDV